MKVKDIMNKAIVVDFDISLKEAAKIMSDKNIGSLIVLKDNKIIGIITENDIVRNVSNLDRKISQIMSKRVLTINEDEDIDNAAELMGKNKIKRVPVIDKNGRLTGIVTTTDLIAHSEDLNEDFFFE